MIANEQGRLYGVPGLAAVGMKAGHFFRLTGADLVRLPAGSAMFLLPQRQPVGWDTGEGKFVTLERDPFSRRPERCFAAAAFVAPGFTITHSAAYVEETARPPALPLFGYAAVALYQGEFYAAAIRVERERRHDPRYLDAGEVRKAAARVKMIFPGHRLVKHLEHCALVYGCPGAQNFFLGRYEGPLPASPFCNARCFGCISRQPRGRCPASHDRIAFVPEPEELAEAALFHLARVADPVVSFGQGCEGEPLLAAEVLRKAIRLIRKKTGKGVINVNTNASDPRALAALFDEGLDSVRVSLNSAREEYYVRYFRPQGYSFRDVLASIRTAKKKGGFVSVNYLTMPGFTDQREEAAAFRRLLRDFRIDMIQWRNLNYDPRQYFREMKAAPGRDELRGIRETIAGLKRDFPAVMMGYYNPSRRRMRRSEWKKAEEAKEKSERQNVRV